MGMALLYPSARIVGPPLAGGLCRPCVGPVPVRGRSGVGPVPVWGRPCSGLGSALFRPGVGPTQATGKGWPYYIRGSTGGTSHLCIVGPLLAGGLRRWVAGERNLRRLETDSITLYPPPRSGRPASPARSECDRRPAR